MARPRTQLENPTTALGTPSAGMVRRCNGETPSEVARWSAVVAMRAFRPPNIHCPTTFVTATETTSYHGIDPYLPWKPYLPGHCRRVVVEGDHHSIWDGESLHILSSTLTLTGSRNGTA
jgi:hypothetical protein